MHIPQEEYDRLWKIKPMVSADAVVIKDGKILLTKRATEPFMGRWVIPGGMMDINETIEQTAIRELREETGVTAKILKLVGVYSGSGRDPRGTSITVCFLVKFVRDGGKTDRETSESRFFPVNKIPENLGFDHAKIIKDALKVWRSMKK